MARKLAHHRFWLIGYEEPGLSDHKLIYGEFADRVEHRGVTTRMILCFCAWEELLQDLGSAP